MRKSILIAILIYIGIGLFYGYKAAPTSRPNSGNSQPTDYVEIAFKGLVWPYNMIVDYINYKKINPIHHN